MPVSQILGLFHRLVRKFVQHFNSLSEIAMSDSIPATAGVDMQPVGDSIDKELVSILIPVTAIVHVHVQNEAAHEYKEQHKRKRVELQAEELAQYEVGGADEEWTDALAGQTHIVSIRLKSVSDLNTFTFLHDFRSKITKVTARAKSKKHKERKKL